MRGGRVGAGLAALAVALFVASAVAAAPVEETVAILEPRSGVAMHTRILRPRGPGPFRLAILNHGSAESPSDRASHELPSFEPLTGFLVAHGFAVAIPQRPGHGATAGAYRESAGSCENPDYLAAGYGTADAIEAALAHMLRQTYVRKQGVVLGGHSAGAWGALALASRGAPGVSAVVAFAPGRGGRSYGYPNRNCAPERLVEAAGRLGRSTRVPSVWFYARNDTFFPPALSAALVQSYGKAGGKAAYHLFPEMGVEGHFLAAFPEAQPRWAPVLKRLLRL